MKKNKKKIINGIILIAIILFFINLFFYKGEEIVTISTKLLKKFYMSGQEVYIDEKEIENFYFQNEEIIIPIYFNNEDEEFCIKYSIHNIMMPEIRVKSTTNYELKISLNKEIENIISIQIYKADKELLNWNKNIMYIKPIQKQFLSEIAFNGLQDHLTLDDYDLDKEIKLLNALSINHIRTNIRWSAIGGYNRDEFNYEFYDKRVEKINENNIHILAILDAPTNYFGEDKIISTNEEEDKYLNYVVKTVENFENIDTFEIMNEPNFYYNTEKGYQWYSRVAIDVKKALPNKNIISGGTVLTGSQEFIRELYKNNADKYLDGFAFHLYDNNSNDKNNKELNLKYKSNLKNFNELKNEYGGFYRYLLTETGVPKIDSLNITEELQASYLIQQSVLSDNYNIEERYIYNFRNTSDENSDSEEFYGLLHNDYTPKPAYYAMKNYYENTNGAEYIGTINLADGLEAHVYDKDGKPKIITWSTNTNNTITIPYENFTASDMYGNAIENTDRTLKITSSPVYLDNVSTKYFYEAISNTALQKYAEFEEKFSAELKSVDGLQEQLDKLKNYMSSIANNKAETQEKSIEMMHEHFYLGTMILDSFNKDKLNVEYVKVSSMLDMLNDIGSSYEDLLTVSSTSREAYYKETEKLLNKAETTINNNSDLNILYPSKILDFAKELHDKSKYIIGLEEENDIKTGLIVSNSLHAYYLADWANDFANIYVNKYIKENPVTVSYSNTDEFTNKDVTVTLNIGSDSKVINNEGKNTYTFNKNGTFTFEYERRGQAFKQEITITNIDKEAPIISGIVNGKIYTNSVKPVITDKNLAKVEVLFNGTSIQFNSGNTLKEEGIYNITATDKAGNSTSIEMYIVEKGKDGYVVDGEHILNVRQETKVEQFAKKFNLSTEYTIKRNNNNLLNTDIIATGDILQLKNGSEYTIIVAGDINRDGKVTTYDLSTFRRYILNLREFDKLEEMAADINVDKQELGVKDYTRMRIEILGEY